MKHESFSASLKSAARLVLLTCVLASLCISTAEGIRLLPFPDSSAESGDASFHANSPNSYSETLRDSNNLKNDSSAKYRKGNSQLHHKSAGISAYKQNHLLRFFSSSVNREYAILYSLQIASKPRGRAPPAQSSPV